MYKEIIICIVIITFVIALNNFTADYLKDSIDIVSNDLESLKVINEKDSNEEEILKKYDKIYEDWKNRYDKLAYYIEHNELEKVETNLVGLKANLEKEEYDDAAEKINIIMYLLEHIRNKDVLNLKNIF